MDSGTHIWIAVILAGVVLFYFYARTGRFFRCVFSSAVAGFAALAALWALGNFFDIALAITPLTLTISALLGVPGVIGMLLLPLL